MDGMHGRVDLYLKLLHPSDWSVTFGAKSAIVISQSSAQTHDTISTTLLSFYFPSPVKSVQSNQIETRIVWTNNSDFESVSHPCLWIHPIMMMTMVILTTTTWLPLLPSNYDNPSWPPWIETLPNCTWRLERELGGTDHLLPKEHQKVTAIVTEIQGVDIIIVVKVRMKWRSIIMGGWDVVNLGKKRRRRVLVPFWIHQIWQNWIHQRSSENIHRNYPMPLEVKGGVVGEGRIEMHTRIRGRMKGRGGVSRIMPMILVGGGTSGMKRILLVLLTIYKAVQSLKGWDGPNQFTHLSTEEYWRVWTRRMSSHFRDDPNNSQEPVPIFERKVLRGVKTKAIHSGIHSHHQSHHPISSERLQ